MLKCSTLVLILCTSYPRTCRFSIFGFRYNHVEQPLSVTSYSTFLMNCKETIIQYLHL